jgi:phosphate-selective porin OprO/OprP
MPDSPIRLPASFPALVVLIALFVAAPVAAQDEAASEPAGAPESAATAASASEPASPTVAVGPGGFRVTSADGHWGIGVGAFLEPALIAFPGDDDERYTTDFTIRRARPSVSVTLGGDVTSTVVIEAASGSVSLLDAILRWQVHPTLALQLGRFRSPVGFDMSRGLTALPFSTRGLTTQLVPQRDVGIIAVARPESGIVDGTLGVTNGAPDGGNASTVPEDERFEVLARLAVRPLAPGDGVARGLELGVDGSLLAQDRGDELTVTRGRTLAGQTTFAYVDGVEADDAHAFHVAAHVFAPLDSFWAQADVAFSSRGIRLPSGGTLRDDHLAWQAGAGYVVGGTVTTRGIRPDRPLHQGGLGALDLRVRVGQLRYSEAARDEGAYASAFEGATEIAGGLSWWAEPNVRAMVEYYTTDFAEVAGTEAVTSERFLLLSLQTWL